MRSAGRGRRGRGATLGNGALPRKSRIAVVRVATQVLSALMIVIGLALAGRGVAEAAWLAVVVGLLFVAAGAGRLYVERQR